MVHCKRCQEMITKDEERKRNTIEVCTCGHGKVHHIGSYGDCTCPITWKHIKCSCIDFVLDWGIWNNKKMTASEYYILLQNTLTQESSS